MPIRRCLCCRRHSIFLLESSRVGEHLPLFRNNSRFCVCLVVSLKVLEVVLGSVCLLLVRPQAIVGYDMSYGQNLVQGEGTSINRVSVWWTGLVGSSQLRRDGKAWLHCKQTAKAACSVWEAHCHAWRTTLSITRQCRSALWAQETNFGWGHRRNIILGESSLSYQSSHSPSFVHDSHPRVSKYERIQLLISMLCDGQRFKGVGDRRKERAIARHDRINIWRLRIKLSCFTLWVKSRRASLHVHVSVHWALLCWLNLLLHFFLSLESGMRKLNKPALFKKTKAHLHTCSFISR